MAIAAAAMTSCGNSTPTASLKSDVDSVSYAIGMAQTQGLKEYLVDRLGVDTAYLADFIKGLNEGANAGDNKKKAAYYAGIQIGQQISNQMVKGINHELFGEDSTQTISMKNFMAGFISGTTGKQGLMTVEQAQQVAQEKMEQIKTRALEATYGDNKKEGEDFLAKNKTAEGEPVKLRCNQTIKGWTEAMVHMPAGSIWEIYIPQELAYGTRAQGDIKPFSMLTFKVELLEVNPKK